MVAVLGFSRLHAVDRGGAEGRGGGRGMSVRSPVPYITREEYTRIFLPYYYCYSVVVVGRMEKVYFAHLPVNEIHIV